MISSLWLERPAAWRRVAAGAILLLATLPAWPVLWQAIASRDVSTVGGTFFAALRNSVEIAAIVGVIAAATGLPAGVTAALYNFPGRSFLLSLAMLPLLVPSFLWAIGWSALAAQIGPFAIQFIEGTTGCVLVFLASSIPLVALVSYCATLSVSGTQIEAARLAGAERAVFCYACRYAAIPAGIAAVLAGVLTLSDPGPGQILGRRTAASEVLTSFASLFDFGLAGRQCALLTLVVLLVAAPLAGVTASRFASQILSQQTRPIFRISPRGLGRWMSIAFGGAMLCTVAAPLVGLLLPLTGGVEVGRAWTELTRTSMNTLTYAVGAGLIATSLGFLMALLVGRDNHLRSVILGAALAMFALPPSLGALGIVYVAANFPAWLDWLTRSRATVCIALGLRFLPLAILVGLRSWGTVSQTWTQATALHGVSLARYLSQVLLRHFAPAIGATVLIVGLLATAEIGTVLLIHPPGQSSLPLAIFTVMANSPESLVSSLCLSYFLLAIAILASLSICTRGSKQ